MVGERTAEFDSGEAPQSSITPQVGQRWLSDISKLERTITEVFDGPCGDGNHGKQWHVHYESGGWDDEAPFRVGGTYALVSHPPGYGPSGRPSENPKPSLAGETPAVGGTVDLKPGDVVEVRHVRPGLVFNHSKGGSEYMVIEDYSHGRNGWPCVNAYLARDTVEDGRTFFVRWATGERPRALAPKDSGPIRALPQKAAAKPASSEVEAPMSYLCEARVCALGSACTHHVPVRQRYIPAIDEWDLLPDAGR